MKKTAVLLSLAALAAILLWAHPVKAEPLAFFNEYLFDAGRVKQGMRITHDFIVMNRGDAPLEIFGVSPA
jgi:hypothetical protein